MAEQRGATAIEYGLIAALISISIILLVQIDGGVAGALQDIFNTISTTFNSANTQTTPAPQQGG